MKKYLSAPLAIGVALLLTFACSCSKYQNGHLVVEEEGAGPIGAVRISDGNAAEIPLQEGESESEENANSISVAESVNIDIDIATEEKLASMLPAMSKILEYQSTNNYALDLTNPEREDFWNLVAIALTYSEDSQQYLDGDSVFHIKKAALEEYVKTFFPQAYAAGGIPSYKDCYSVSYDPGPATYDIN